MGLAHVGIVGVAMLCQVPQASASILTYTYTGTVSSGTDTTGVFGVANTDLSTKTFTAVLSFDTSKFRYTNTDGATFSYQMGGTSYGVGYDGAHATLSIGGSAPRPILDGKDLTQNTAGVSTTSIADTHDFINDADAVDFHDESLKFSTYSPLITFDYTKAFSVTTSDAAFSGTYALSAYVRDVTTGNYASFDYAFANLQPTSLTVTNTLSAVPLPASLPMFGGALLALAGIGVGLSRRALSPGDRKTGA